LFPFTFCTLWLNQWWLPLDVYFYCKSVELNLCKSKYKKLEFLLNKYKLSAGFSLDFEIFLKSCSPVLDSGICWLFQIRVHYVIRVPLCQVSILLQAQFFQTLWGA
jgi:hypothetical protein